MRFIKNSDYIFKISQYDFETLTEQSDLYVLDAELKAQAEIELYLRKKFDLAVLFKTYPDYVSGNTYGTGNTVWFGTGYTGQLYTPLLTTTSLPTGTGWTKSEVRNSLIIDWMTTIALFKLHQRISYDNVPKQRKEAYDMVVTQLKMIQQEKVSTDFPELATRTFVNYVTGSTSQDANGYLW